MTWEETRPVEQREQFIKEWLKHELTVLQLCDRYGVSRKTGHKWIGRFKEYGRAGLEDRSRAPLHSPQAIEAPVVEYLLLARKRFPHWGPRKLLSWLETEEPSWSWPAASTVGDLLKRHGFVEPRRRRRKTPPMTQPFASCDRPNATWCADFKGHFALGDGSRCHPLTITDAFSRYLLRCKGLSRPTGVKARQVFESAFREFGLPARMRTDNGCPFATLGAGGLSPLAVWWVKLGIIPERILPGCPQQNGRHERMHRTLKAETTHPPGPSLRSQQRRFDAFIYEYNEQRPHEALGQATPSSVFEPSTRTYPKKIESPDYPAAFETRRVDFHGTMKWKGERLFLSESLAHEPVGVEQDDEGCWRVWYGPVYLGALVRGADAIQFVRPRREPRKKPPMPRGVSPMSPV